MSNTERYMARYPRFVARAVKGREVLYSKEGALAVRKGRSAEKIAEALNQAGYKTEGGLVWRVFETDYTTDMFALDEAYFRRNGNIGVKPIEIW